MHTLEPRCIIIGAQKAGSTALHAFLRRHPRIHTPPEKELDFFSCDMLYARGYAFYHHYFKFMGVQNGDISFEASPSYLKHEHSADRIAEYNADTKIVCMVRDPIARAFSAFNMYRRKFREDPQFFKRWYQDCYKIAPEIRLRKPEELDSFYAFVAHEIEAHNAGEIIDLDILSHGMYFKKLQRYYDAFDPAQILVVNSEALLENTRTTLKRVCDFVNIDFGDLDVKDGETVFKGGYSEKMTEREVELLSDFYGPQNAELFGLIGQSFDWKMN